VEESGICPLLNFCEKIKIEGKKEMGDSGICSLLNFCEKLRPKKKEMGGIRHLLSPKFL
jgi:hypothetical protein